MSGEFQWLIGISVTVMIAAAASIIAGFKSVYTKISASTALLHERIETVRNSYVRTDHMDREISHIDKKLDEMRSDSQRRHDELLQRISTLLK